MEIRSNFIRCQFGKKYDANWDGDKAGIHSEIDRIASLAGNSAATIAKLACLDMLPLDPKTDIYGQPVLF